MTTIFSGFDVQWINVSDEGEDGFEIGKLVEEVLFSVALIEALRAPRCSVAPRLGIMLLK